MNDNFYCEDAEEWSRIIKYEKLLENNYLENIEYKYKSQDKLIALDKEIEKKVVITKESVGNTIELLKINPKLKILNGKGYKIGDYVELKFYLYSNNRYLYNLFEFYNNKFTFYIDEVAVSVRQATDMFMLLTDINSGYFTTADGYTITISLKGITEYNYADYYNQSLFMLTKVSENEYFTKGNKGREYIEIDNLINCQYINKNYNEVFYFYNEAMRMSKMEISFLYLYKILEYFFLIARKDEFEIIIKDRLNDIINKAIKLNIIDSYDLNSFSEELYLYRNSIVHGKSDFKLDLKIPNDLCEIQNDLFWRNALKYISEILMFKYCIQKKD